MLPPSWVGTLSVRPDDMLMSTPERSMPPHRYCCSVNKIALSPNSLVGVPALEYIDALVKAGYDGIGLRMYASPGVNYESVTQPIAGNPALMRDVKHALEGSGLILYDILSYYIRPNFDLPR